MNLGFTIGSCAGLWMILGLITALAADPYRSRSRVEAFLLLGLLPPWFLCAIISRSVRWLFQPRDE